MDVCVIEPGGAVAPFQKLTGTAAEGLPQRGNEMAGVVFDPSGRRVATARDPLEVDARRRVSLAALRRGLAVDVWLDEPGELRVALRTDALRKVSGRAARPSGRRPSRSTAAAWRAPARDRWACAWPRSPSSRPGVTQVATRAVRLR